MRFELDRPISDPSLCFLTWTGEGFTRLTLGPEHPEAAKYTSGAIL